MMNLMKKNYIYPHVKVVEIEKDSLIATSVTFDGKKDDNLDVNNGESGMPSYIWDSEDFTIQ